ncbi:MAG TPA: AMP-binding protein [Candidatus Eisenbacteria bacterium]|nr:AMP-binding protein [Candidatus Eisenbacteria bacterium]
MQENFVCRIEDNARRLAGKTALIWKRGALTWSDLDRHASGLAGSLSRRGVEAGDRIAIVLPNGPDFAIAFLAVLKLGATPAPLNPLLTSEELAMLIGDLKPKIILKEVSAEPGQWQTQRLCAAPALILYTSGSTGAPKGAVFSHDALAFANRSWGETVMGLTPDDRVLVAVPLAHSLGLNGGLLAPLLLGSTVVVSERFAPEPVAAAARQHRVTVFPGVATIFRRLLNAPGFSSADFSSLRIAVSGAAPCPWELALEWREKAGSRIIRGYGMTELFRPISFRARDPSDVPEAVGKAVPGVELALEGAGVDDAGELLVKSPAVMDGYLGDQVETEKVVRAGGWFKTGDLAAISPEGYVRILGRTRERILRGGYSIFPQEIEAVLLSHPEVAEATVMGVPHPELGEEVAAFVSLKPTGRVSSETLLDYCRDRLARYKYPRSLEILPELPKGTTGKVLKSALIKS